jgi:excisionase family DNA binding protein
MRNTNDTKAALTPLAVTPRNACTLLAVGKTSLFGLLTSGELQSYKIGKSRRIPLASIQDFQARKLAEEASP